MKTYNVFWTGGVDSTFLVTQLSQFPVVIRSFYIKGQTFRQSEPQELAAITTIRELLIADPRTKAEILPITVIEKDDSRIKDREIVKAYRRLNMKLLSEYKEKQGGKLPPVGSQKLYAAGAFFSPQYVPCASLAQYYGAPFEIGLTADDLNNCEDLKLISGVEVLDEVTNRKWLKPCENNMDKDAYMIFGKMLLPIAGQRIYKRDIWQWYAEHDYLQVRSKTITCQEPIVHEDGTWEPCGRCAPCIVAIHENGLEPFTEDGIARYRDYMENHEKEPERFRLKGF